MGISAGKILGTDKMPGGKVRIISSDKLFETHNEEMKLLKEKENIAYDMLYLVPHSLVRKDGMDSNFAMKTEFENNGVFLWDGTNSNNRESYSVRNDEVRVLQYDSARGLEGWTVVCMGFDEFIKEKDSEYVEGEIDSLLLESPEEHKKKYIYNWVMIPLTRAIDTLIITLNDCESDVGRMLRSIADENPDFITWMC